MRTAETTAKVGHCVLLVLGVGLLASCASIIKGGGQGVTVRSNPPDADVKVMDIRSGAVVGSGKSPLSLKLDRGAGFFKGGKYKVVVEKAGYAPREILVDSSANGWYIAGNLVFGGLIGWIIVDPATGAMWSLDPDEAMIDLTPAPATPSAQAEPSIMVATIDSLAPQALKALKPIANR